MGNVTHRANLVEMSSNQVTAPRTRPLLRHCSAESANKVDSILFQGSVASIGMFRCPVGHPSFRDSGPTERCIVVFPRTSVWIQHEGSRPFVADPNIATIYNRAQRYERAPLSPDGDRCDWFALSDAVARDIVSVFDPAAAERDGGPFTFQHAPSTSSLYLAQRRLAHRVATGAADALETDEAVVSIVARVVALAHEHPPAPLTRGAAARRRRLDLVEHAKAEIARTVAVNRSTADLADAVGTSVFHLCRIFRAVTGRTMHAYRTDLRVRLALELLSSAGARVSLSRVAYQLGFANHAHFVRHCQYHLGATPSAVREQLCRGTLYPDGNMASEH